MLKGYTKFYFNTLEGEEKKIYRALYEGFKARRNEIEVFTDSKRYTVNDIHRIAEYVYNDTPAFYYFGFLLLLFPNGVKLCLSLRSYT